MGEISEQKREQIAKEAKEILSKFSKSLQKVKLKTEEREAIVGGFRDEKEGKECNEDFRERMFANAPKKNDYFILAERKKW